MYKTGMSLQHDSIELQYFKAFLTLRHFKPFLTIHASYKKQTGFYTTRILALARLS